MHKIHVLTTYTDLRLLVLLLMLEHWVTRDLHDILIILMNDNDRNQLTICMMHNMTCQI